MCPARAAGHARTLGLALNQRRTQSPIIADARLLTRSSGVQPAAKDPDAQQAGPPEDKNHRYRHRPLASRQSKPHGGGKPDRERKQYLQASTRHVRLIPGTEAVLNRV
jgi:hypothetical protein